MSLSLLIAGLKELQVFVDLALMSVGDDPYNTGMVQALHSAVTGYAPLIFDLNRDCGHLELLELCRLVWRELEVNSKLPKQLVSICYTSTKTRKRINVFKFLCSLILVV